MREDFTSGFISGKNKSTHAPALLLKLGWAARSSAPALELRLADRAISTGSESWQPLVLGWQGKGSESLKGVTLWNGESSLAPGASRFSDLFAQYPPERASVVVYQWFEGEGLNESDLAPLFAGVIGDPLEYDGVECRLRLTPYSESLGQFVIGAPFTLNDYPNVPVENLGQMQPIVIGSVKGAPGMRVRKVARSQVTSVILPGGSTLNVSTTKGFPDSGVVLVNDDEILYTGKTADRFTGCTGIAEFHFADDEVLEKVNDHRFLFSDPAFPIQSIDRVCVADQPVDPSEYSVDLVRGEVIFSRQPREVQSIDTKFLQAQFDSVAAGNSALDPSFAMQPNLRTRYAQINQTHRKLSLSQTDDLAAIGQIGRVLLRVEHFMEEKLAGDSVSVRLSGVGEVGVLSPPAEDDVAVTTGSTDMTHNHLDTFGFPIDIPQPPISPTSNADHVIEQGANSGTGKYQNLIAGQSLINVQFPPAPPGAIRGEYQLSLNVEGGLFGVGEAALFFNGNKVAEWNPSRFNFDYSPSFTINGSNQPSTMSLSVGAQGGQWTVSFTSVKRLLFYPHGTQATQTPQQTLKTGSTQELSLQPPVTVVTEKSTRTIVDVFDITDQVDGKWDWFTGREVEVEYTGSNDGRTVYVLHTAFEIEYARRRLKATDEITADVEGLVDDAAGSLSGSSNALLDRPDHVFLWCLKKILQLPDSAIDPVSFSSAGDALQAAVPGGYRLSGVIQNTGSLESLWKEWMVSSRCRLSWDAGGRARLFFRPLNSSTGLNGQEVKTLDDSSVLLNPKNGQSRTQLKRGSGSAVNTVINLPYDRNWNAGTREDRYRNLISVQDPVQAELFGTSSLPGGRPLDWCTDPGMAQDLAAFYLAESSRPLTSLECDVPLEHLDLELGDIVNLNFPETGLNGVFAQLSKRTDLAGGDTPDGLQAVRLLFHLFPIEYLQEFSLATFEAKESSALILDWQADENQGIPVVEGVGIADEPGTLLYSVQTEEGVLLTSFKRSLNSVQSAETISNDLSFLTSPDYVAAREGVYSSANGGWGQQAWGFSGWGGREVMM